MEKKVIVTDFFCVFMRRKLVSVLKLAGAFLLLTAFSLNAMSMSQNATVSLSLNNVRLKKVFEEINRQTSYDFFYDKEFLDVNKKVTAKFDNVTVKEIMDNLLGKDYKVTYESNIVVIAPKYVVKKNNDDKKKTVKGKVVDEKGNPLPGVTVQLYSTNIGVATDGRGKFSIAAKPGDVLKISFIGYKNKVIEVTNNEPINVKLIPEVQTIEEVSVVAFGEQKKESIVSSITTVRTDKLKNSSSDLTSTLAGNIAGVVGWQTGGMPGALTEEEMNTKFYIRGVTSFQSKANRDPLILLDGVEASKLDLARLDPDDIESFNVMKDASATAMYGARGANGVIYVKTKKGEAGKVYTSFRYERIWATPTRELDVVDPITYMRKYNEALTGRNENVAPKYSEELIRRTASGEYPDYVYPAVDWYDKLFKNYSVNDHYALNVRGGTEKLQYYASVNYNVDNGMLKTDRLNQFDVNVKNEGLTFRINLNAELTSTARLTLNSFTTYDVNHGPGADARTAYKLAFTASPVDFAPTYPADEQYDWPHVRFGRGGQGVNPYKELHSGYYDRKRYSTINKFEYIQNLSSVIKGLEARMSAALSKKGLFTSVYKTSPAEYALLSYDQTTNKHELLALNPSYVDRTLFLMKDDSYTLASTTMDYDFRILHTAAWGKHQTSFTAVMSMQENDLNNPQDVLTSLPNRNLGYSARATYGYNDRYFAEASFGYNGSERFSNSNKMGFFPAFGLAWLASKENFMKSTSGWLDYLKFRFSYGKVGNDGVIEDPRFVYLQDVGEIEMFGLDDKRTKKRGVLVRHYGNPETTWEISEQTNLGVDFKMFKGLIDVNMDIYQATRHNVYDLRFTLPASMGLALPPLDNSGKVRSRGIDLTGKIQKSFSNDFWIMLNGTFTYSDTKIIQIEEAAGKPEWQKRKGHSVSQQFGYIAEGLFQDQAEIDNAPDQGEGKLMPGDIRYRDVDGNGKIDVNDAVAIGYPEIPKIIYGFTGFVHYKNFEFDFAFQGSGNRSFWIDPVKVSPFYGERALLTAFANDHWTEENHKNMPLWPRLSTDNIMEHNPQELYYRNGKPTIKSTYFMRNGKFLRCTKLELAYYLNKNWAKKFRLKKCKFYARVSNPFIISDFKLWDVELGESGFNYPIQRYYTLGMNISF